MDAASDGSDNINTPTYGIKIRNKISIFIELVKVKMISVDIYKDFRFHLIKINY